MARIRSPNYPQVSLAEAVRRVDLIRSKEGRNAASREVLAKLLGFGGLNGASMGILSAISKYGLVEDAGDKELKVSDLADAILFPNTADEKEDGLWEAANKPALFYEINVKWPEHPPSDENLRSYLMRRGFSQGALDNAIACYRETMALVTGESGDYAAGVVNGTKAPRPMPDAGPSSARRRALVEENARAKIPPRPSLTGSEQAPMISIMGDGKLLVNATLADRESVEALIVMLNAVKEVTPRRDQQPKQNETDERREA